MANLLPEVIVILSVAVYIILFSPASLRLHAHSSNNHYTMQRGFLLSDNLACIFYFGLNLPILDFAPLFVVVTMLGVGIDYDIFFVTRIREEVSTAKQTTKP